MLEKIFCLYYFLRILKNLRNLLYANFNLVKVGELFSISMNINRSFRSKRSHFEILPWGCDLDLGTQQSLYFQWNSWKLRSLVSRFQDGFPRGAIMFFSSQDLSAFDKSMVVCLEKKLKADIFLNSSCSNSYIFISLSQASYKRIQENGWKIKWKNPRWLR